ncbi:MAG: hypothetical protein AB7G13_10355 [Lautropia sp.]
MVDIDGARALVLAEWRSRHPIPTDNFNVELAIFVEGLLACSPVAGALHQQAAPRQTIRDWVVQDELERRQALPDRLETVATL